MPTGRLYASRDFLSGAMFVAVGVLGLVVGSAYEVGTAHEMGPGYFPTMIAWGVIVVGVFLSGRSLVIPGADDLPRGRWRPFLLVISALVLFGMTAQRGGLLIAAALLVMVGSFGGPDHRWREAGLLAAALALFATAVFIWGLGLPLPVFPR